MRIAQLLVVLLFLMCTAAGIGAAYLAHGSADLLAMDLTDSEDFCVAVDLNHVATKGGGAMALTESTISDWVRLLGDDVCNILYKACTEIASYTYAYALEAKGDLPVYAATVNWGVSGMGNVTIYLSDGSSAPRKESARFAHAAEPVGSGLNPQEIFFCVTFCQGEVSSAYVLVNATSVDADDATIELEEEMAVDVSGLLEEDWVRIGGEIEVRLDTSGRSRRGSDLYGVAQLLDGFCARIDPQLKYVAEHEVKETLRACLERGFATVRRVSVDVLRGSDLEGEPGSELGVTHPVVVRTEGDSECWFSNVAVLPFQLMGMCYTIFGF